MLPQVFFDRDAIIRADRRHVWRPYTSSDDHQGLDPLVVARADGAHLEDVDGRRYLDGNASWWVCNLGHGHPRLRKALTDQAEKLMHCAMAGATHEQAARLAEELTAVAPKGIDRAFFSDDGSTAVEVAIKIAFQYWQQNGAPQRQRFVALSGAFHGDTLGATSLGGIAAFHGMFGPLLFDVYRPAAANREGFAAAVLDIERRLQRSDDIAAVVIEPLVQGAAGMQIYDAGLLERLSQAAQRNGCLLIADEVFTGYGRTGAMWACDHAGVAPDLLCTAKGFSGGVLPFAATLASERVYDGFRGGRERALMHGHSFYGNPLGCAVAREVLAIYREDGIVAEARRKAGRIADAFADLARLPGIENPRSLGMIGACDLGQAGYLGERGWRVFDLARRRGAYLRPLGDTVYVAPPLTIADRDLEDLLEITVAAVAEVAAS